MQLIINVDETMYKDILDKELKALSHEDLKEVIIECIKEYFTKDNFKNLKNLIVMESGSSWDRKETPTLFTKKLIESCDYSELQSIVNKSIEDLNKNHHSILEELLLNAIVRGLFNTYSFSKELESSVREILMQSQQN